MTDKKSADQTNMKQFTYVKKICQDKSQLHLSYHFTLCILILILATVFSLHINKVISGL